MTSQQAAELEFWHGHIEKVGARYYYSSRAGEYYEKTRYFPQWHTTRGLRGIDIGCGCVSVFEGATDIYMTGCDCLALHYHELLRACNVPWNQTYRVPMSQRVVGTGYDFAVCINMIDHTPNPEVTLEDIYRALKPGGMLYFEVNFEAGIAPPHWSVWNRQVADDFLNAHTGWQVVNSLVQPVPEHNQSRLWAEYVKV